MGRRDIFSFGLLAVMALPLGAQEGGLSLPSGRQVYVQEALMNQPGIDGLTSHFRFVAEGLTPHEDWSEDMLYLCETYALPMVLANVPAPRQIVIALSDRLLPFGEAAPEALQFFEAYLPQENACIWEIF